MASVGFPPSADAEVRYPDHDQEEIVRVAERVLDDLGWHTDDPRDSFVVHVRDEGALVGALRQWRDWQIQAIEDVRRDREAGVPVVRTAPELLAAAERMAVVADMLRSLSDERFRSVRGV